MNKFFQFLLRLVASLAFFLVIFVVVIFILKFFGMNLQTLESFPALMPLTIAFAVTSSMTTFDKRLIQARRNGSLPPDEPMLPGWVGLIVWIHWTLGLSLLFLNWRCALLIFFVKFALSVLPVLETMGNILMAPFRVR